MKSPRKISFLLAALGVLLLGPLSSRAQDIEVAKTLTNAQNVAAVADAALAAGYDGSVWKSPSDVVDALTAGISVTSAGSGAPMSFKISPLEAGEKEKILPYLSLVTSPNLFVRFHTDPNP